MKSLLKKEWRLILFGFLMNFWSAPGQTFFISLFSGEIRADLNLSHGDFGRYYSIATLLSAGFIVWTGALIDRTDLRRFSLIIVMGLAAGALSLSLSQNALMLVISLLMLRHFGQGLMFLTASTTVVRYLEKDKSKANAISSMGYSFSEIMFPKLTVILIAAFGWRISWRFAVMALVLTVLPFVYYLIRDHHKRHQKFLDQIYDQSQEQAHQSRRQWRRTDVLKDIRLYLFMPNLMAQSVMFTGFIFHQVHLVATKGWSLQSWTTYFALYAIIAIGMKFVSGYLADRFSATVLVPLHTVPLMLALFCLSVSSEPWIAIVFLVLLAITSGMQGTISVPFLSEQYGDQNLGSIKSLVSAISVFATATSPFAIGWLIDQGVSIEYQARVGAVITLAAIILATIGYVVSRRPQYQSL